MNLGEIILGVFIGILCGFFIMYTLQVQRPYPDFLLDIMYYPWVLLILLVAVIILFFIDDRAALLLLIIILVFLIDMYFLGKEKNPKTVEEEKEKLEESHYEYPVNTNQIGIFG